MSEREDDRNRLESDRLSEAISASLDGELPGEAQTELAARLARDPSLAQRARAFEEVDAGLRAISAGAVSEESLDRNWQQLRARLDRAQSDSRVVPLFGRWPIWSSAALAAAAALLLYLASGTAPDRTAIPVEPGAVVDSAGRRTTQDAARTTPALSESEAAFEAQEERAIALGYGQDPIVLPVAPGVSYEDLEIIEQLDLLDYLASQTKEKGRG